MKTLLLDGSDWDFVLDASGNWALAAEPYALAQDAASEIKTFRGEVYYDTSKGVPYWQQILGHDPPPQLMQTLFTNAALLVPGVVSAVCYLRAMDNRQITGQVQITDASGNTATAG